MFSVCRVFSMNFLTRREVSIRAGQLARLGSTTMQMRRLYWTVLVASVCLVPLLPAQNEPMLEARANAQESAPDMDPVTAFAMAQERDNAGARAAALGTYRAISKQFPFTPQAANSQFRLAQIFEEAGDLKRAFDEYQAYLTRFPDSKQFDAATEAQVRIANTYLEGKKVKVLGLPIGSGYDTAAKMYTSILATAPFSPFAPMAQFNLGLAYEKQGRVAEAVQAYQTVLDRYPTSALADDALYQIGYVNMRVGFAGGSQDLSALILARNTFEDFLFQFPDSEKVPQARENMALIQGRESGDILSVAKFYDRSRDFRAAFIYYNDVIRRNASSPDAELARIRIEELRNDYGDDALRAGTERAETGERVVLRRRLQAQVETPSLADYVGPPRDQIVREELPVVRPRLRTEARDVSPLSNLPPIEPDLPSQ
jgi:outer membrane protein assembly factor BamD